jgi:drug/metabolite transporter superfamily protein YnfA
MYKYAKLPSSIRGGVFAICLLFFHGIPTLVFRVGQNRICTPYMTVYMVISLLDLPYVHHVYVRMYDFGQPY